MKRKPYCFVFNVLLGTLLAAASLLTAAASGATLKITKQPSDAVVYVGDPVLLSVTASGGSNLSYQWYLNTTNGTGAAVRVAGATSSSYSPSSSWTGSFSYYCMVYSAGSGSSFVRSDDASVTVRALPVITSQPSGISVYSGETASLSVRATGSGVLTYQWYSNTTGSKTNAQKISGAVYSSYSAPTAAAGSTYYYCVVTNTDSEITSTPQTATVTSGVVRVTVTAVSQTEPTITSHPTSAGVYAGTPVQLSVGAVAGGTLSYQWYRSAVNGTEAAEAIQGATSKTVTVPTDSTGTVYYYCDVTNTPSSGTETYRVSTNVVSVTVKMKTVITTQPEGMTVNIGGTATLSVAASGSGTLSYQWYAGSADSSTGGSRIAGATGSSYTLTGVRTGSAYYYCVVTNTDSDITVPSEAGAAASRAVKLTVLAEAASAPLISAQPVSAAVYAGTAKTLSVKASGTGDLSYQWYAGTAGGSDGGDAVDGATEAAYTVSNEAAGTFYYYCVVKNTVETVSGAQSLTASSAAASMTVLSLPAITTQPSDAVLTSGGSATLSVAATGGGSLSYQWYSGKTNKLSGTKIIGGTGTALTVRAGSPGITYYYCVVTNTDSRITEKLKTAAAVSAIAKVTVVSPDAEPPAILKQPERVTALIGGTAVLSVSATGSGVLSYQWYSNIRQSDSGATGIDGATGASYSPPTDKAGKTYYFCLVTNTDASKTRITSKTVKTSFALVVVASREPVISKQPPPAKIYTGSAYTLNVTAAGSGVLSYQWYGGGNGDAGGGTAVAGATGAKFLVPSDSAGIYYYYCVVTNTMKTASGTESGKVSSSAARVEIVPGPSITAQPADAVINGGDSVKLSVTASGQGTLSYQWYAASRAGSAGAAIKNATAAGYTMKSAAASTTKTYYYYCVVTVNDTTMTVSPKTNIKSSAAAVTVRAVNAPPPVITGRPVSQTLKTGAGASLAVTATGSGTLTYQWYSNTKNSVSGAKPIAGATGSTLSVPTASAGTMYYYCVVTNTDGTMPGLKTASVTGNIVKIVVRSA